MNNAIRVLGWYGRLRADQVAASTISYEKEGQSRDNDQAAKKIAEGNLIVADLIDKALGKTREIDILVFKADGEIVFQLQGNFSSAEIEVPGVVIEECENGVNRLIGTKTCHMGIFDPLFISSQYPDTLISKLRKFDDGNGFAFRILSGLPRSNAHDLNDESIKAATAANKIHSLEVQKTPKFFANLRGSKSFSVSNDSWEGYAKIAAEYYAATFKNVGRLLKCQMFAWGKDIDSLLLELSNLRLPSHPFQLDFSVTGDVPDFDPKPEKVDASDYNLVKDFFSMERQAELRQFVSRDALSTLLSLCPFEVPGIKYIWEPQFNMNPPRLDADGKEFSIGKVQSKGIPLSDFKLSPQRLTEHVFITGKTGSGKTNSCKIIADKLLDQCQIIVLESAKNEYAGWAAEHEVKYFAPGSRNFNDLSFPIFRIPYEKSNTGFCTRLPASEHIGGLWGVISSAFPLEGPMIPLLKRALHRVYEDYGWALTGAKANIFQDVGDPKFPSVEALCAILAKLVDELGYEGEIRSNIEAALVNRLRDLHVGVRKEIFSESEESRFSIFDLLRTSEPSPNNHIVISFDNLESEEDKALALGLFLLRLREQVRIDGIRHNHLRRLVIIEEAHRIVPNVKSEATINPSVGQQKEQAVSRFNDSISEMRAYGVGFMIVDQSPSKVSLDVLRNIGTKIVHSVQEEDDRKAACSILGEEPEIGSYLVGLDRGFALVHTRGMQKSELVKVTERRNSDLLPKKRKTPDTFEDEPFEVEDVCNHLLSELITGLVSLDRSDGSIDHMRRNEVDLFLRYGIRSEQGKQRAWQSLCEGKPDVGLVADCASCQLKCRIPAILQIVAQRDGTVIGSTKADEYSTAELFLSTIQLWKSRSINVARSVNELTSHVVSEYILPKSKNTSDRDLLYDDIEKLCNGFVQCLALHSNYNRELANIVISLAGSQELSNLPSPESATTTVGKTSKLKDDIEERPLPLSAVNTFDRAEESVIGQTLIEYIDEKVGIFLKELRSVKNYFSLFTLSLLIMIVVFFILFLVK